MSRPAPTDRAVEDPRVTDLRRMRVIATLLLVAMTVVFAATSVAQERWEWLAYLRAFAEAGMVGACADWFAVVALFRRPLGLPIPHTGIVPRNKARIAGALGRFITNNFLTPKVLSEKLVQVDAAQWVADWLGSPDNAKRVARNAAVVVPEVVRALPRELMSDALGRSIVAGIRAVPAAPVAGNLLAIVWAQGQTQKVLDRTSPGVEGLIERLSCDPVLRADIEAAKNAFLDDPLFIAHVTAMWAEIDARLPTDVAAHAETIAAGVEYSLLSAGRWLREDGALKVKINRWIRYLVTRTISPRRAEIGAFVTNVVEAWDSTTLVNRLELQVGRTCNTSASTARWSAAWSAS
jgi:uncharacterized membrane-anchored protein YjiN (DUF445 family)